MITVFMPPKSSRYRTRSKSTSKSFIEENVSKVFQGKSYPNDYHGLPYNDHIDPAPRTDSSDHIIYNQGDKIMNKYILYDCIGEGAFGKVISTKTINNNAYAIKIIRNVKKYRDSARYEIFVLQYLLKAERRNKNCIEILDFFNYFGHACIVFHKYGQSVFEFMKSNDFMPFSTKNVRHISYQLIDGISFLHEIGIIHTDLKPENMILENDSFDLIYNSQTKKEYKRLRSLYIKIIDFGNAVFISDCRSKIICTRHYRPVEVILELSWNEKVDVWSVGCILFELYTGITMFQVHSNKLHLALIEEILGRIPSKLAYKTKLKYFRNCEFDWDLLDSSEMRKVDKASPLSSYFNPLVTEDYDFYKMIREMLELDPKYRRSMYRFMNCHFLKHFC